MRKLYEPFNAISHAVATVVAVVGLGYLLYLAEGGREYFAAGLFGLALIFMFTSSALYHGLMVGDKLREILHQLDYVSIYVLIAGTVSPVALLGLRSWTGQLMNGILWLSAGVGILLTFRNPFNSRWAPTLVYLVMGWTPIAFYRPLSFALGPTGLFWCIFGGVLYSIGALMYMVNRPELIPGWFGPHELWHLFIIAASGSHYILVAGYLL